MTIKCSLTPVKDPVLKKYLICLVVLILSSGLFAQKNITFRDSLQYAQDLSDVWAYHDVNGNEYALVGTQNGVSIVNVTNPDSIFEAFFVFDFSSFWRDIKTWNGYAYVSNESLGGLLIINLQNLPGSISNSRYTGEGLSTIHNLHISDNGILGVFGSNVGMGGCMFYDLANPTSPTYLGQYNAAYLHDGYLKGDTLFGAELNNGQFSIIDFSNMNSLVTLGTQNTPNNFTHNVWPTDDGNYLFTTDEVNGGFVGAFDISNVGLIEELDRYQSSPGSHVIPHNVHVINDFLVTSYYKDGVTIVDASRPHNLIEVGHYDTSPFSGSGFAGAWGATPFLPSGNILVSDIEEGLFVLTPSYVKGCYLEGTITDAVTFGQVNAVSIEIQKGIETEALTTTNAAGEYAFGVADSSNYTVRFTKTGYHSKIINNVILDNGQLTTLDIKLVPTSLNNCSTIAQVSTPDSMICLNDTFTITNLSTNGYNYEWYKDSIFISQSTNLTTSIPTTGMYQYMLVSDQGICSDTATLSIQADAFAFWTGNADVMYSNPNNWEKLSVPDSTSNVILPVFLEESNPTIVINPGMRARELFVPLGAYFEVLLGGSIQVGQ